MTDFTIKRNDEEPAIRFQLLDDASNPVDITGFREVRFIMRQRGASSPKIDEDTSGAVAVTDAANGIVQYEWKSGDTDTNGRFNAEFEVTYSGGDKETFPNSEFIEIHIPKDIS